MSSTRASRRCRRRGARPRFARQGPGPRRARLSAAHDISDGGLACALAEMAIAAGMGMDVDLDPLVELRGGSGETSLFGEGPGRDRARGAEVQAKLLERAEAAGVEAVELGTPTGDRITIAAAERDVSVALADAERAWRSLGVADLIRDAATGRLLRVSLGRDAGRSTTSERRDLVAATLLAADRSAGAARARHRELRLLDDRVPGQTLGRAKINGSGQEHELHPGLANPASPRLEVHLLGRCRGRQPDRPGEPGREAPKPNFITHSAGSPPGSRSPPTASLGRRRRRDRESRAREHRRQRAGRQLHHRRRGASTCGLAADQNFVYLLSAIHRSCAAWRGQRRLSSISGSRTAAWRHSTHLYWGSASNTVGRVPVSGGAPEPNFIASPAPASGASNITVQPQYVFGEQRSAHQHHRAGEHDGNGPTLALSNGDTPLVTARRAIQQDHDQLDHPQEEEGRPRSTPRCRDPVRSPWTRRARRPTPTQRRPR